MRHINKLCLTSLCFIGNTLQAQQINIPATSFSHIYFTIDTASYRALSQNKFFTDTLFYYSKGAVTTDQGNWDGQYFEGEADYWEVFQPDTISRMAIGDIGLGFMLHQPYAAKAFQQHWQKLSIDNIQTDPFTNNAGKDTIMIEMMNYRDSMLTGGPSSFFALYYHPSVLRMMKFTEENIQAGIDQKMINERSHANELHKRPFKKIEKLFITLTPHEYNRHKIALLTMGYKEIGNRLFKKDIEIDIQLNPKPTNRLNKIAFSLTREIGNRTITVSPHLHMIISGENGELILQ